VETFQVTHPFHPLSGRTFEFVTCHHHWGGEIVAYQDEAGNRCSVPLKWTSLASSDPFVHVSAGRAAFRVSDLLELSHLLASLKQGQAEGRDA
jgi:hypothetical protein